MFFSCKMVGLNSLILLFFWDFYNMGFGFSDVSIRGFAAVLRLKEETLQLKDQPPVIEEFIPLKGSSDESDDGESERKKKWLSSAQLWNTNFDFDDEKQNPKSDTNLVTFLEFFFKFYSAF